MKQFCTQGFVGRCVCELASQKPLLQILSLQNQPESLVSESDFVKLTLRCCTSLLQGGTPRSHAANSEVCSLHKILQLPFGKAQILQLKVSGNEKGLLSCVNIIAILASHGFQEVCVIFRFVSSDICLTVSGFNNKLKYRWHPLWN